MQVDLQNVYNFQFIAPMSNALKPSLGGRWQPEGLTDEGKQ